MAHALHRNGYVLSTCTSPGPVAAVPTRRQSPPAHGSAARPGSPGPGRGTRGPAGEPRSSRQSCTARHGTARHDGEPALRHDARHSSPGYSLLWYQLTPHHTALTWISSGRGRAGPRKRRETAHPRNTASRRGPRHSHSDCKYQHRTPAQSHRCLPPAARRPELTPARPPPPGHPVPPASNPCPRRQVEAIRFPPTRSARGGPDAGRSPYGAAHRPNTLHCPGESTHRPPPAGQGRLQRRLWPPAGRHCRPPAAPRSYPATKRPAALS